MDQLSDAPELWCALEELGEIRIVPVSSRYSKASRIWNALMQRWHYLGKGPLCGAQIRYLVESSRHGFVGALAFSAAQWRMKERDQYIGWSEAARRAHLHRVVGNSRFLILPSVHVPNLASRVLGLCMTRLGNDWSERYGYAPVLAETFVDPQAFCRHLLSGGQLAACRSDGGPAHGVSRTASVAEGPKDIYVYPLRDDWKEVLCAEPEVALGSTPRAEAPGRLDRRGVRAGAVLRCTPQAAVVHAGRRLLCAAGRTDPAGFPRLGGEDEGRLPVLPESPGGYADTAQTPHRVDRWNGYARTRVILAVQDTTTLNYTAHPPEGVGPINTTQDQRGGIGPSRHPGLHAARVRRWGCSTCNAGRAMPRRQAKEERRHELPIEEKESLQVVGELPGRERGPEALSRYDADQRGGPGSGHL